MEEKFSLSAPKAILHSVAGVAIFIAVQFASLVSLLIPNDAAASAVSAGVQIALLFAALSLYCKKLLPISLRQCRVRKPRTLGLWVVCALLLPALVAGVYLLFVPGEFAVTTQSGQQTTARVAAAVFGACIAAGITEELLFRGFILRILEARWGRAVAVFAPSLLFGVLHILNMQSPGFLDVLQLLVAGTAVGVMFSLITLQANSIWPAALVHGLWNLVIVGGILDIGLSHYDNALYTYTLTTPSALWTGGAFGIESALPAIAGYLLVIVVALVADNRRG